MFIDADVNEEFVNKAVRAVFDLVNEYNATIRDGLAVGSFIISWSLGQGLKECLERNDPVICQMALEKTLNDLFKIIKNSIKISMVIMK